MIDSLIPLPPRGGAPTPERMRQAAQGFEAQVLSQLLQPAFAGLDSSRSAFGGGSAEAQWRPMLVDAFAAAAVRAGGGIGLTQMLLREMERRQNATETPQENRP
jgi:Rod binding domain-containing protein